jgi:hypothetical protein
MSNPRVIAVTASAALIAGVGAGAAVYAVDLVASDSETSAASEVTADSVGAWQQAQNERTTVYSNPRHDDDDDDHDDDDDDESAAKDFKKAPADTGWDSSGEASQGRSNTSKSS